MSSLQQHHAFYSKTGNNPTYTHRPDFVGIEPAQRHNIPTRGWTNLCPRQSHPAPFDSHYPIDDYDQPPLCMLGPNQREIAYIRNLTNSGKPKLHPYLRDRDPYTEIPPSPPNGGLYGGPQSTKPWANIPIAPTTANLINNVLKQANPPPGAEFHYPGGNRLGNNYQAMPGIYWYNPDGQSDYNMAGPLN